MLLALEIRLIKPGNSATKYLSGLGPIQAVTKGRETVVTNKLPFSILFDGLFRAIYLSLGSKELRCSFWGFDFFFLSLYINMNFSPPMFNLAGWLTLTFTSAMWSQQIKALSISTYHVSSKSLSPHILCFPGTNTTSVLYPSLSLLEFMIYYNYHTYDLNILNKICRLNIGIFITKAS